MKRTNFVVSVASLLLIPISILNVVYSVDFTEIKLLTEPLTLAPPDFWKGWISFVAILLSVMLFLPIGWPKNKIPEI